MKNHYKKYAMAVLALLLCVALAGCGASNAAANSTGSSSAAEANKPQVVCSVFPQYDWLRQIIGDTDGVQLTLLLKNGTDMHSYQPTAADIVTIAKANLFVYTGGESDAWVADVLRTSGKDVQAVSLMQLVPEQLHVEEVVEGMQGEADEAEEEGVFDEHLWLSLKNAVAVCEALTQQLCTLDAANAETYKENCAAYVQQLTALDDEYTEMVQNAARTTILVGDRFPFRYLAEDYHLTYYAAFIGCSAETEASFETIRFLAGKVDELALPTVLVTESSDQSIAKTIISTTNEKNAQIAVLDSLQSVTQNDIEGGKTYLSAMQQNLQVLQKALN